MTTADEMMERARAVVRSHARQQRIAFHKKYGSRLKCSGCGAHYPIQEASLARCTRGKCDAPLMHHGYTAPNTVSRGLWTEGKGPDLVVKGVVARADIPNVNGITYTRGALEDLAEQMKKKGFFYFCEVRHAFEATGAALLGAIGGEVRDAGVDADGDLVAVVKPLSTPSGFDKLAQHKSIGRLGFSLAVQASVNDDDTVSEATFVGLYTAEKGKLE